MREAVPRSTDLVVCNPPYLPEAPRTLRGVGAHPLAAATIGTELLQQVIRDAPALLSRRGEMFVISSSLAEPEVMEAVPKEMNVDRVASRIVPFDIEAVRGDGGTPYIQWLKEERGLQESASGHHHAIVIYRIATERRLEEQGRGE